jgi:hypothetical protein
VVVVLSKEFISKRYPMEELQLLLKWRRQGSKVQLLPVFLDITYKDLNNQLKLYKTAAGLSKGQRQKLKRGDGLGDVVEGMWEGGDGHVEQRVKKMDEGLQLALKVMEEHGIDVLQRWVKDLQELMHITGARKDQVLRRTAAWSVGFMVRLLRWTS